MIYFFKNLTNVCDSFEIDQNISYRIPPKADLITLSYHFFYLLSSRTFQLFLWRLQFDIKLNVTRMKSYLTIFIFALVGQCLGQSARFIVNIAQLENNIPTFRCVGTAITFRHVLTTASCADIPQAVVQVRNVTIGNNIAESMESCEWKSV